MGRLLCVVWVCVAALGASAQPEGETGAEASQPGTEAPAESKSEAPAEPKSPVREAVEAGNYFFMKHFEARDAQAVADLYSEDARVIAPGAEPVEGRAAIAAFWAAVMEGTKSAHLETLAVESDGDLAFEEGVVRLTANDGSESVARYVVVWKRVGRRWQLHRDIWNTGPAAATEAAATEEPAASAPEPTPAAEPPAPGSEPELGPGADEEPFVPEEPL